MRMTLSHLNPYNACQFIQINDLQGKMFNCWNEGGFIAWAEEPGLNGFIPLKIFIDGRAQSTYAADKFILYNNIVSGGPIIKNSKVKNTLLTSADSLEFCKWQTDQLRGQNVWIVLMPLNQLDDPFYVISFDNNPDWRMVFADNKQKIFVDIKTQEGKKLYDGIFTGKTLYPDEFSENLVLAHYQLLNQANKEFVKQGLEHAIKAFNASYTTIALEEILNAAKYPEIKNDVERFCQDYLNEYENNKDQWSNQDGYFLKTESAIVASNYVKEIALHKKSSDFFDFAKKYETETVEYNKILGSLNKIKW